MSRLAVLAFTLTALPWSGESFVSTVSSSGASTTSGTTTTIIESSLPQSHRTIKSRVRPYNTRRQLQQQHHHHEQQAQDPHSTFSSPMVSSIISYRRSSSMLQAALLNDPSSSGPVKRGRRSNRTDKKSPGWHRRIFGKISRRRGQEAGGSESSSSLPSASIEQQHEEAQTAQTNTAGSSSIVDTFVMYERANNPHHPKENGDFVVRNFDLLVPEAVLPVVQVDQKTILSPGPHTLPPPPPPPKVHPKADKPSSKPPVIDSEYFDVSITPAVPLKSKSPTTKTTAPTTTKKGFVCKLLENFLFEKVGQRWPVETPEHLEIEVRESPDRYNNIGRLLFKRLFRADATLKSKRIIFPMIRFSSAHLRMEKVTLNLMGFFEDRSKMKEDEVTGKQRYPKPFDVHIDDLTMTRHDLLFSPSIKNGLRQLLINVLKDRGLKSDSIRITSIDILRNGKISCIGEAQTHFPSPNVHFEVRSGISFTKKGHVLTFPGLEVTLNRDIGLFVPVHPTLDLDVGHNTKFHRIQIDGHRKKIRIAASVTITPEKTRLTQNYKQMSDSFSAIFFYDVGRWLTRLGRFSK